MLTLMNKRLNDERGFTLIELLVVMIIIAILMGIAIPKFLGNKDKAQATKAKTAIRLAQQTIEACAASMPDGTFTNGTTDCRTNTTLTDNEPSLNKAQAALSAGGMDLDVTDDGTANGYLIEADVPKISSPANLQLRVSNTGAETRDCTGTGCVKVANGGAGTAW